MEREPHPMLLILDVAVKCVYVHLCCRKVDYINAKGFIKDPKTVVATLASGQQVCYFVVFLTISFCEHVITNEVSQYHM